MTLLPTSLVRASRLFEQVTALARLPWAIGVRRPRRAALPVVSVGNIALGGTGKTPLVAALAMTLAEHGLRPAILTRGYRRREVAPMLIRGGVPDWELVGDEPALLARALPGVPIVVNADRLAGARRAIEELGATHLLLDDGFQHWRLARDLDVVVVDAADPFCSNRPRREHPRSLRRADAVVVVGQTGAHDWDVATDMLRGVAPRATILSAVVQARWVNLGAERQPASTLAGRRVLAAAGIAAPWRFTATLEALGAEVVGTVARPDHHPWRAEEIEALLHAAAARQALPIVTAKDVVKVTGDLADQLAWLEIAIEPLGGSFVGLLAPVLRTGDRGEETAPSQRSTVDC